MNKFFFTEDVRELALICNYKATKNRMLRLENIDEFEKKLEIELEKMNFDKSIVYPLDPSKILYFISEDEFGIKYAILKDNFNYVNAINRYFNYSNNVYESVLNAIRSNDVLNTINLEYIPHEGIKKISDSKKLIKSFK